MTKRIFELDVIRGAAIVLMVIFHFGYDLSLFGYTSYNTNAEIEWRLFRATIVSGFLLSVGMSSYLAYRNGINWNKLGVAFGKLAGTSVLITLGSLYMYPQNWIYFGVIHFITVALPISLIFINRPIIALFLGIAIIMAYFLGLLNLTLVWEWSVNTMNIPKYTVDMVSFIPWFGVVLLGIFIAHKNLFGLKLKNTKVMCFVSWLGKHSLIIYLIHQPILFAGFNAFKFISAA
jgi:uncharacterized membrane protein